MKTLNDRLVALAKTANQKLESLELDVELDFYTQGLDSLDHVQILMKVEEAFGAHFEDTDYDECHSIERIAEYLVRAGHTDAAQS